VQTLLSVEGGRLRRHLNLLSARSDAILRTNDQSITVKESVRAMANNAIP